MSGTVDGRSRFDAPWDGGVKFATGMASLVLALVAMGLAGAGWGLYASTGNAAILLVPVVAVFVPVVLLLAAWGEAPGGYSIDDSSVRVERRTGPLVLPLASVREVRVLEPSVRLSRVGGSGSSGFLGYWGDYRNAELGTDKLYATRSDGRVLLSTDGGTYVVTPSSREQFVEEIQKRVSEQPRTLR